MSNEFLSQDEVDALLKGVGPDEAGAPPVAQGNDGVQPYDLAAQEKIIRNRVPALGAVNERFVRLLRLGLFNFMGRTPDISVGPVRAIRYREFTSGVTLPAHVNSVQMKPLRGNALFVLEPALVHLVVDNLFGGDSRFQPRIETRDFTPTEQRIAQRILYVALDEYQKAWKDVVAINCELLRSEANLEACHVAGADDIVIAVSFKIEVGANGGGFHLCIPYSALEPVRHAMEGKPAVAEAPALDRRWLQALSRQVQSAEVDLTANLLDMSVTVKQLMSMSVGDVLSVEMPPLVTAHVDGVPIFDCRYGVLNGQYALRIENVLTPESLESAAGAHHA